MRWQTSRLYCVMVEPLQVERLLTVIMQYPKGITQFSNGLFGFIVSNSPLVIFRKQLGDVLLLEPALSKLAACTGSPVLLATRPAFDPLLSLMDGVLPAPRTPVRRAASVISFDPSFKAGLWALTTLAPKKQLVVTHPKYLRSWHNWIYRDGCTALDESQCYRAEYFFNALPCATPFTFRPPRLQPPLASWLPSDLPEKFVLLHTTSAWQRKSWPFASWGQVLSKLHAQGIGPFVVTGGSAPWEAEYVAALEQASGIPLINLCGRTTLTAYLAVVNKASLVLCIDGSATHLAAAFQRPSVTLFGPTHPLHWHFPSAIATLLDARDYVKEERPSVANIPEEPVLEAAIIAWGRE
jgi:ADP-heptose:LPS heptosyltransferase